MSAKWPGATHVAIYVLIGVLAVQWLPRLPPWWLSLSLMSVPLWLAWRWPRWRACACVVLAGLWAMCCGQHAMDARLPAIYDGQDLQVQGHIEGLPEVHADATSALLRIDRAWYQGKPIAWHGRARVNWYAKDAPVVQPCSRWQWQLRLRRPRGLVNPGGADGERSTLARGIDAVGYVRDGAGNQSLAAASAWCLDGVRAAIAAQIEARVSDPHDAALLRAFTVGDVRGLSQQDWEVARANGISHLIAISGFHVGVAAVFGVWLCAGLYALWPRLGLRWPRVQAQALVALLCSLVYAALAGFGMPTLRTVLMIAAVALAQCLRRASAGSQALALALLLIVLVDPLAVLNAGFWLSFVGVAFLMFCLQVQGRGLLHFLRELSVGQLLMTVSLLPLTLWFFGEASLVGALSNLVAVPFVSFVIVPVALVAMVLLWLCPPLATPALWVAANFAHTQWWLLQQMATWPGAHWFLPSVPFGALLLATLGAIWLFMPRGVPLRWLGACLFLPLLWPQRSVPEQGAFRVWMLDVGQGLAVIVQTHRHVLVYDAGPRYPSGFDLGAAVVLPSLHALGINRLDMLMISHADNDHAGGAAALVAAFPSVQRLAGEPERMRGDYSPCAQGQGWNWDGVQMEVLWPPPGATPDTANERSCVLMISGSGGRFLLTGDIDTRAELRLASELSAGAPLALQVPHHGSKSSSASRFIEALEPSLGLVSAGWRNRFGHPRPEVLNRYAAASVRVFNTAEEGALQLDVPAHGPPRLSARWRERERRYWRE